MLTLVSALVIAGVVVVSLITVRAIRDGPPTTRSEAVGPAHGNATSAERPSLLGALETSVIVIDPGHNGGNVNHPEEANRLVDAGTLLKPCSTVGTSTGEGYSEAAYNLDVARRLADLLREAGARAILTRSTNTGWGPCITKRAGIGNRVDADAAISIHADAGPPSERGFHVIYPPSIQGLTDDIALPSRRLALDVRDAYRAGTRMPYATYVGVGGLDVRTDLGGLNLSDVPKVFIETGNMLNPTDARLLSRPRFREREALALRLGLAAFLRRAQ
jgi:N-acetylmuramoyl-L-alanine amidase